MVICPIQSEVALSYIRKLLTSELKMLPLLLSMSEKRSDFGHFSLQCVHSCFVVLTLVYSFIVLPLRPYTSCSSNPHLTSPVNVTWHVCLLTYRC